MLDPLKHNPHSLTVHLAYNVDNSVVDAHGNVPSELLTELGAVESHGSRDMRKELVVQVKKRVMGAGDKGDPGARSGRGGESREVRRGNGRESRCRGSPYGSPSLDRTRGASEIPC